MQNLLAHNRRHDLTFYASGRIDISSRIVNVLALQPGDVVSVAREADGLFFYIATKANDTAPHFSYSGRCFRHNKTSFSLRAQSTQLCNEVLKLTQCDNIARLPVGDPVHTPVGKAIPIIIHNVLNDD